MQIDWSAMGSMITGVGTIASAGAIAFAAWVGRRTLRDFRAERVTRRRFELAEEISAQTQMVGRALATLLWLQVAASDEPIPASTSEGDRALRDLARTIGPSVALESGKSTLESNRMHLDAMVSLKPQARIFFGQAVESQIDELAKNWSVIETAISMALANEGRLDPKVLPLLTDHSLRTRIEELVRNINASMSEHISP